MTAILLQVSGEVQGVFFRVTAKEIADRFGVRGWVRNCDDGTVELHAEGNADQLQALADWCHNGPDGARVTTVEMKEISEEYCTSFDIHR